MQATIYTMLFVTNEGEIKTFHDKNGLKIFMIPEPALQKILEEYFR